MAKLGDRVKDRINGYTGIVTGRAEYLFGCVHVLVAPEALPTDGKHPDSTWIDEDRVIVVGAAIVAKPASAVVRAGGPGSFDAGTNPLPPRG